MIVPVPDERYPVLTPAECAVADGVCIECGLRLARGFGMTKCAECAALASLEALGEPDTTQLTALELG